MSFFYFITIALLLFVCLLLCLVVLAQEGKGGGLGASFGGDNSDSLFGTSTPAILKKVTGYLAIAFLALCVILSCWTGSLGRQQMKSAVAHPEQEAPIQ